MVNIRDVRFVDVLTLALSLTAVSAVVWLAPAAVPKATGSVLNPIATF